MRACDEEPSIEERMCVIYVLHIYAFLRTQIRVSKYICHRHSGRSLNRKIVTNRHQSMDDDHSHNAPLYVDAADRIYNPHFGIAFSIQYV